MADPPPGPGGALAGGRYRLEGRLGAGAGGEVFAARDVLLERPVAVKRLLPGPGAAGPAAAAAAEQAAEAAARLLAEARALARLVHPHVVTVHDAFEEAGRLHVVMERVDGPTLRQRLDEGGPLGLHALARLAAHLAAALAHAHGQGIVHRDVKPENVLLAAGPDHPGGATGASGSGWTAKLADFGLAYSPAQVRLTLPGMAVGTPAYVAPEQALGQPVDGRADLYALGCLLYEAATGAPPFAGADPLQVISQHLHADAASPSSRRPDLPAAWDALLLRLLAKRPEARPPSAAALLATLAALEPGGPGASTAGPRHNLPRQLTSFVGREREVAAVTRLLADAPLLTLVGVGGTGKTRLALQVAADVRGNYPDGVWLVELAPLADPVLVPQAVATAVGVREEPGRPLLATLAGALAPRRLLLVLDNCEHLLDACARLADALLRACPDVRVLATSREALGIAGEVPFRVPSLALALPDAPGLHSRSGAARAPTALSEAVQLFAARAAVVQPGFAVTAQNAAAVAEVCRRLDGIPLALELAAARVRVLPVEQLLARLDDRFRLLTGGSRAALERHQTLQAAVDWSYDLLTAPERALFARLSVFAGGFTLEAAEAVGADDGVEAGTGVAARDGIEPWQVLDLLTRLVDKSLVVVDVNVDAQPDGTARYRLLETLRQYGAHQLTAMGDVAAAVRRRHAAYFLALVEQAAPELEGPRHREWLDRLEAELDNLRQALRWCQTEGGSAETGLRLAAALWPLWRYQGRQREGRDWLEALLALPGAAGRTAARARALYVAGSLGGLLGDRAAAHARHEASVALWRELGDGRGLARALTSLGSTTSDRDPSAATAVLEEAVALAREAGDRWGLAVALRFLGNLEGGKQAEVGRPGGGGDPTRPSPLEECAALFRELGDPWGLGMALNGLGDRAFRAGDYAAARAFHGEALAQWRTMGDTRGVAGMLARLAAVARAQGDLRAAVAFCEESLALGQAIGHTALVANALTQLGHIALAEGDRGRAAALLAESLRLPRAQGQEAPMPRLARCLAGLAAVAGAAGQAARAVRLGGAAAALAAAARQPLNPADQETLDGALARARPALTPEAQAAAWAEGQGMTVEQAVASALEGLEAADGAYGAAGEPVADTSAVRPG